MAKNEEQTIDWANLVGSVRNGDEKRAGELVELTQASLFQFCLYLCGDKQLAEDLSHDTYLKTFTSLHQLKKPELILSWMKQIARHLFLDYVKSAGQAKPHISMDDERSQLHLHAPESATDRQLDVIKTLNKMSEEDRVLLVLIDIQECSYQEIAQTLEIAVGTVKSRVHRARLKFSEIYEKLMSNSSTPQVLGEWVVE